MAVLWKKLANTESLAPSAPNRKLRLLAGFVNHVTGTSSSLTLQLAAEGPAVTTKIHYLIDVDGAVQSMRVPLGNKIDTYTMVAGTTGYVVTANIIPEIPYGFRVYYAGSGTCTLMYEEV